MPDAAQVNRSLSTIKTELEYLRDSGALTHPQMESIMAQLPQHGGKPSQYVDMKYSDHPPSKEAMKQFHPEQIAQQAQDPGNPAHPNHPQHHEWAKGLATKFGNAAVYGAGATLGSDMVNDALHHVGL